MEAQDVKEEPSCLEERENIDEAAQSMLESLRPVPTPVRSEKPQSIQRPVSTDAQPRPSSATQPKHSTATDFNELRELLQCHLVKREEEAPITPTAKRTNTIRITEREYKNYEATLRRMCNPSAKRGTLAVSTEVADRWKNTKTRKQLIVALINCKGDKESFNQRMEVVIRNVKEGRVVIDSGFYSESAMKTELKFDKDRIKAIIAYCTKTKARKRQLTRRDKYQRHILEYWIDLRTSGSLSRSHQEEFTQYVEIIDNNASLPNPVLGNESLPCYDEEDEEESQDTDDGDDEDERGSVSPKFKRKKSRRSRPSTPRTNKKKREEKEKQAEVETALDDIEKIPQILGEILKVRIKVDKTLEELKHKKKKGEQLMKLHDDLAEIRAEHSKDDPSKESSRITMEEKKLRTVLRAVPKAKGKAGESDQPDDESEAEEEEPKKVRPLMFLKLHLTVPFPKLWHVLVEQGLGPRIQVSDRLLCSIASGFFEECSQADPDTADDLKSTVLLQDLHRASRTKHESSSSKSFAKTGLSCPIDIQQLDVGNGKMHPVLPIKHFLKALADGNQLSRLWGSTNSGSYTEILPRFWRRWKAHDPQHAVFSEHRGRMAQVLPLQLHADEGQTLKKTAIMIWNFQSILGFGLASSDDCESAMALNYTGSSYATRFLYTVCHKRFYKKDKSYFDGIMQGLADELVDLFYNGVTVNLAGQQTTFYAALVGLKGDWPIQARIGNLTRHFCRKGVFQVSATSGICHLCRAGEQGYNANDYTEQAAWRDTYLTCPPWDCEGVFAELAGSGIVVITDYALAGPGDIPTQLDAIYVLAVQHCKATKTPLHMDALTRHLLGFAADFDYPVGNWFKGADTAAMCSFLEAFWANHLAETSESDEYLHGILRCLRAANVFMRTLYRSGLWLSTERCKIIAEAGLAVLKSYMEVSSHALQLKKTRFKVTPKYHALIHIVDMLVGAYNSGRRWTLSPLSEGTQMDEDFIGRIASKTMTISTRQVHSQTLKKYLTAVWTHLPPK
ncbi:unnamed protein product [Symbiodinium sp. CCMP2456]|nr:unnamed protein product [Symbiodinium sp. CCMP2456]